MAYYLSVCVCTFLWVNLTHIEIIFCIILHWMHSDKSQLLKEVNVSLGNTLKNKGA